MVLCEHLLAAHPPHSLLPLHVIRQRVDRPRQVADTDAGRVEAVRGWGGGGWRGGSQRGFAAGVDSLLQATPEGCTWPRGWARRRIRIWMEGEREREVLSFVQPLILTLHARHRF